MIDNIKKEIMKIVKPVDDTIKEKDSQIDVLKRNIVALTEKVASDKPVANNGMPLDAGKLSHAFREMDDEYYEKALKITAIELTHAQRTQEKQLDLQIEKEKRRRLISGFS